MALRNGWTFVSAAVAVVALWSTPAQADTCNDQLTECRAQADMEWDPRVREIMHEECYQRYLECSYSPHVCGDGFCGSTESCANCTADCGTGEGTVSLGTVKRNCYSTTLSTHVDTFNGRYDGGYCYYPVYEYVAQTCEIHRQYQIYTCGNWPYIQEVYESSSTEYKYVSAGYYSAPGPCAH